MPESAPIYQLNANSSSVYQVRIDIKYITPPIWRRLLIPSDMKLSDLHLVIQSAFLWTNSHFHEFIYKNMYLSPAFPDEGETEESELYNTMTISDLIRKKGEKVTYVYDFGDDWNHEIVLEEVLSRDELPDGRKTPLPLCTNGKRARPMEDCGGVPGYEHFVKVLNNPKHPEYQDLLNWAGPYDFEFFDIEILNEELQEENYGVFVWDDEDDDDDSFF